MIVLPKRRLIIYSSSPIQTKNPMFFKRIFFLILLATMPLSAFSEEEAIDALEAYMEFAPYSAGAVSPEQLEHEGYNSFLIIDTRNAGQFNTGHIPNAINIEWREILGRRSELPTDRPILLYCETGLLSSKAHLALSVAGFENVKVLWGGYIIWSARQSFEDAKGLRDAVTPITNQPFQPTPLLLADPRVTQ